MLDIIDVLEKMGQDAQWSHASQEDVRGALTADGIAPALQAAIAAGSQTGLQDLLGIAPICGMLDPGDEAAWDEEKEEGTFDPN